MIRSFPSCPTVAKEGWRVEVYGGFCSPYGSRSDEGGVSVVKASSDVEPPSRTMATMSYLFNVVLIRYIQTEVTSFSRRYRGCGIED